MNCLNRRSRDTGPRLGGRDGGFSRAGLLAVIAAPLGSALLIGTIAFFRADRAEPTSSLSPDPAVDYRPEFTNTKDSGGARYSRGETREKFRQAVGEQLALAGVGRAEQAQALLVRRADLLFDPDFDRWSAYTNSLERNTSAGWTAPTDPAYREDWERMASAYRDAVIDPQRIRVEPVDPNRSFPQLQPGTLCLRNNSKYSAPYPFAAPNGPNSQARGIEVFVPVTVRDGAGKPVNATISFVLVREHDHADWQEISAFVYLGAEGFGRPLSQPPF